MKFFGRDPTIRLFPVKAAAQGSLCRAGLLALPRGYFQWGRRINCVVIHVLLWGRRITVIVS